MPNSPKKPSLEEKLNEKLIAVHHQEEETRAKLLADKLNLPYLNLTTMPIDSDALFLIPAKDAIAGQIVIIGKTDGDLKIALTPPMPPLKKYWPGLARVLLANYSFLPNTA